jgi:hypothetical protein
LYDISVSNINVSTVNDAPYPAQYPPPSRLKIIDGSLITSYAMQPTDIYLFTINIGVAGNFTFTLPEIASVPLGTIFTIVNADYSNNPGVNITYATPDGATFDTNPSVPNNIGQEPCAFLKSSSTNWFGTWGLD